MKATHWVIVALTAAVAVLGTLYLTQRGVGGSAWAQDSVAGSYMVAMLGQEVQQTYPLVLVDTKQMTIMVYEYNRGAGTLEFHCARNFQWDRNVQDSDFFRSAASARNGPSVEQVKNFVSGNKNR